MKLFGADNTLKVLIEHRTTQLKLAVRRIADDKEAEQEAKLLGDRSESYNDDGALNSSRSVIATLEDIEVDPSWLLEKTMHYVEQQVT